MVVHDTANGPILYTLSGGNGGVAAYDLGAGTTAYLQDFTLFPGGATAGAVASISLLDTTNGTSLVVGGATPDGLTALDLGPNGQILSSQQLTGLANGTNAVLDVNQWGSDMLFLSDASTGSIQCYGLEAGNTLAPHLSVSDTDTTYCDHVFALETVSLAGHDFLIGASHGLGDNGITAYRIGEGGLTATASIGMADGIGMMTPTAMQVATIDGRCFVLVASAPDAGAGQSGAVTVMELHEDGSMSPTDHVIDTLHTRFGQVQSLEIVESNGRTYVVAGGGDDGLTLFVLLPNGRLQVIDVMADTFETGLENVSSVAAFAMADDLHLFVSSEISPGVTEVTLDTSRNGHTIVSRNSGGRETGTALDDIMIGGEGADFLEASHGDDILEDGAGSDTLSGGGGYDIFALRADGDTDMITDFEWSRDRIDLSDWPLFYDPGQLSIQPTSTGAIVTWQNETLIIETWNGNSLTEAQVRGAILAGPDRPPDLADLGEGLADEQIQGGRNPDTLSGGSGSDTIVGYAGDDRLTGGTGGDLIRGGSGDDTLLGQQGADTLFGGAGFDLIEAGSSPDSVFGGQNADTINGGDGSDTLQGAAGADQISGGNDDDLIRGGQASDQLQGDGGNDTLYGDGHGDALTGDGGRDRLLGGAGNDTLDGGAQADTLLGGTGFDLLRGGTGADQLRGGGNADRIFGGNGTDRLFGDAGNDRLLGEAGQDTLDGGAGRDVLYGGTGHDLLIGGQGADLLYGGFNADTLNAGGGFDSLFGGAGQDLLYGNEGDDLLQGNAGSDTLFGGSGFDTLTGGSGNDMLWGQTNADTFVFLDGHGVDRIRDFDAVSDAEKIDLSGVSTINSMMDLIGQNGSAGAAVQIGSDVRIDTGAGNFIWLMNVDIDDLDASDFLF